jgi:hypothetical protein
MGNFPKLQELRATLASCCLLLLSFGAYGIAIVSFLFVFGDTELVDKYVIVVPYSIRIGMYSNALGALAAFTGFFLKDEKKLPCGILIVVNAIPPIIAFAMIAVGFILLE